MHKYSKIGTLAGLWAALLLVPVGSARAELIPSLNIREILTDGEPEAPAGAFLDRAAIPATDGTDRSARPRVNQTPAPRATAKDRWVRIACQILVRLPRS